MHKLAKQGTQVVVPYRDADEQRHLKVMGDLGQIVALVRTLRSKNRRLLKVSSQEWDLRNDSQIEECVRHSDIVYNLVGRDYETKSVLASMRDASNGADARATETSSTLKCTWRAPVALLASQRCLVYRASCTSHTSTQITIRHPRSTEPKLKEKMLSQKPFPVLPSFGQHGCSDTKTVSSTPLLPTP